MLWPSPRRSIRIRWPVATSYVRLTHRFVDIDGRELPEPAVVRQWDGPALAAAVRHDASCPSYNRNVRQLLHVGYKVAAELGTRFTGALEKHSESIGRNVTENLYDRHIRPLFFGE